MCICTIITFADIQETKAQYSRTGMDVQYSRMGMDMLFNNTKYVNQEH